MASVDHHSIRLQVAKLFPQSDTDLCTSPLIDNKSLSVKEFPTMMMAVNKENNSADLNTGVKSARNPVDKDLTVNDSNSSEARAFSPRPPTLSGFTLVTSSHKGTQSPPLPNRINISSTSASTSTMSSPASSLCSPTFSAQTPPLTTVGGCISGGSLGQGTEKSAFNIASSGGVMVPKADGAHLLSQHLLELNQMRPLTHPQSPPYKFFQDNAFYQSRQLLTGNDLSEFKLNVQMKEKEAREAFATASEATSEEVVVDGNDDGTEDSQHNTVSGGKEGIEMSISRRK